MGGSLSMFNRILVAIDGSKMSKKALLSALQLSKERYSKVGAIYVTKSITITEAMTQETQNQIQDTLRKVRNDIVTKALAFAKEEGLDMDTYLVAGDPAIQIVKRAEEENYQLIVMGSRGLGAIRGFMLGSVSHKVSQLSHCPVLIIK